jgi:hypothetical protein
MRHERKPDARYHSAIKSPIEPADDIEKALWATVRHNVPNEDIARVIDIYEDTMEREILQAWIFAGATNELINSLTNISMEILTAYRHLCCNLYAFRDKLEMWRWINKYEGTSDGKLLLHRAVHVDGIQAIAHYCGLMTDLDPNHVNGQVMREAYFRSIGTMRANKISSGEASAAHQLMKTAAASALASKVSDAPNLSEVFAKLKHRDMTISVEDLSKEEILH